MKLANPKTKEPTPAVGDYKITHHFAWWPKKTDDGTIWLEAYKEIYEYTVRRRFIYFPRGYGSIEYHGGGWDLRQTKRRK